MGRGGRANKQPAYWPTGAAPALRTMTSWSAASGAGSPPTGPSTCAPSTASGPWASTPRARRRRHSPSSPGATTRSPSRCSCSSSASTPARCPRTRPPSRSGRSRPSSSEPNVVGDVVGLSARLDALGPIIGMQRGQRRDEKAKRVEDSRARKGEIVAEAEKIAQGKDWRNGVNRLRELLEEWKTLPRLEKKGDDELWHRFSSARTSYTRRRKVALRRAEREARGGARWSSSACSRRPSRSAAPPTGVRPPRATATLMQEWKAAGRRTARRRGGPVAALPRRAGHLLRRPRQSPTPSRTRSSRRTRR